MVGVDTTPNTPAAAMQILPRTQIYKEKTEKVLKQKFFSVTQQLKNAKKNVKIARKKGERRRGRNELKKIFKAIMKMPFMQYKTQPTIMTGNQQEAKLRTNIKYVQKK